MTEKSLWQQIKEVVDCDTAIATLQNEIKVLESDLVKNSQQGSIRQNTIKEKQQTLHNIQKAVQLKELDCKALKEKEDRKRVQHDHAQGQKEYMALEREIAALSSERALLEEEIVKQWFNVDQLKKDLADFVAGNQAEESTVLQDTQIKQKTLENINKELAQLTESRNSAVQHVRPDIRTQYERMRNNVPDPIVPVAHSSCSACFYAISPQHLIRLKRSEVLMCMNCYRFLYYDEQAVKDAENARF